MAVLRNLGNGECIFRDLDGRAGRIGVDLISEELLRWLDTNPTRSRPVVGAQMSGEVIDSGAETEEIVR
jgi:hypothetical protein